ncbi:MAG: hypothetical protein J6S21_03565 [Victivallales bacterium]|nr:hypothetical protein [Victivallales bacterium]
MQKRSFTLMEVMIAALIMALSVVATLGIVGTARGNMQRDQRRWMRSHVFANVAEYYLLAGTENPLPEELLPPGYSATCELYDVEEGIPEDALESISGWRLGEFHICLYDADGRLVDEQYIRKILKEDDLGYTQMGAGTAK